MSGTRYFCSCWDVCRNKRTPKSTQKTCLLRKEPRERRAAAGRLSAASRSSVAWLSLTTSCWATHSSRLPVWLGPLPVLQQHEHKQNAARYGGVPSCQIFTETRHDWDTTTDLRSSVFRTKSSSSVSAADNDYRDALLPPTCGCNNNNNSKLSLLLFIYFYFDASSTNAYRNGWTAKEISNNEWKQSVNKCTYKKQIIMSKCLCKK